MHRHRSGGGGAPFPSTRTRDEWPRSERSSRIHDRAATGFSGAERRADRRRRKGRDRFRELDRNGDGRLSRGEWPGTDDQFDRLDHNGDGRLSRAELERGLRELSL